MKKQYIFLAAILVFALVAVIITMTGGDKITLQGSYKLVDASGNNSEMFKATVKDASLLINDDSTGELSMLGQTTPVSVKEDESKISFDGGENYSAYTFDGKKLTVEGGGYKVVFKK